MRVYVCAFVEGGCVCVCGSGSVTEKISALVCYRSY